MRTKVVLMAFVLLAVGTMTQATCLIDFISEVVSPPFQLNTPGSFTFDVCCGTPPYSFSLYSGSLPPGMTLSSSGTISGTPTATGTYTPFITLTDSVGCHVTRAYEVYVE
jgi:hypothetical protein